jgi:hypothetical protein
MSQPNEVGEQFEVTGDESFGLTEDDSLLFEIITDTDLIKECSLIRVSIYNSGMRSINFILPSAVQDEDNNNRYTIRAIDNKINLDDKKSIF